MRILNKDIVKLDLNKLGFDERELKVFKDHISLPNGMILITGPTGSGKTTTLYATLSYLNNHEVNILTIEDPIEYDLPGINQAQMRADIGFTFAQALKTFLRQDPDIIMVGEIRDYETAEIAVRAALTGHLVLSTLHTNDAAGAITRLMDMGVESFLVASCVRMVVAQRLVRKICPHCKFKVSPDPIKLNLLFSNQNQKIESYFKGQGCGNCYHTGYQGRMALFEIMPITPALAQMITRRKTASELKEQAIKEGMRTLHMSGLDKIKKGITTIEEVLKETRE